MQHSSYYISLDVGGTYCRIGLMESVDKNLTLLSQKKFLIDHDFNSGIMELANQIKTITSDKQIQGIGASFPGLIDSDKGIIVSSANLPKWQQNPIKDKLQEYTQIPTFIYHDVAAAAAGEAIYGHAADVDKFVFLIWGTGIGGAKIEKLNDKLHITSFEPGHYIADINGELCLCGQKGCPEINIGGGSLTKKLGKNLEDIPDDDLIWNQVARIAGQTTANVVIFHPTPLVIFGGGLVLNRNFLLKGINDFLQNNLTVFDLPNLMLSKLGDDAALYGAVALQKVKQV